MRSEISFIAQLSQHARTPKEGSEEEKAMHPGWWKFASCDATRRRKEFYAVSDVEQDVGSILTSP